MGERCGNCIRDGSDLLSNEIAVTRAIGDYSSKYIKDNNNALLILALFLLLLINFLGLFLSSLFILGLFLYNKYGNDSRNDPVYKHKKLDGLSCDPHIIKHKLQDKDEFLIIACDGLWEVVKNQVAMTECRRSLRRDGDCNKAAQKLIKFAKAKSCQRN